MSPLAVWARGFTIVFLTASNVVQVSHGHYVGAFINGFLISFLWWSNSHAAKRGGWRGAFWYGLGAATGTVAGMSAALWWYRR